jgi:hypothetical protein
MAKEGKASGADGLFWGIFLLFLGVVFLLQTFNILPWELWSTLWRLWPVLLVIAGISILLRHRPPWLIAAITVILLIASLLLAIFLHGTPVISGL